VADFCKQCSEAIFGSADFNDAAWGNWDDPVYKDSPKFTVDGKPYWIVFLCEGCGNSACLPDGTCISTNCDEKHGVGHPHSVTFWD
jgi:hypothetical protein